MVRQGHLIALVVAFLIGCAVFLVAGASGVQAQASKKEEARCQGTRTLHHYVVAYGRGLYSKTRSGSEEDMKKADKKAGQKAEVVDVYTTNDLPGCPKGGLLLGTDKADVDPYPEHPGLEGQAGDDEIRGLGANDYLSGGDGKDVLYGGPGEDRIDGGKGEDVIYGGDGNDYLDSQDDGQRDKLYCGAGRDKYLADKNDYVDSSCETVPATGCNIAPGCGHDVVGLTSSASASPFSAPQVLADGGGPAIVLPAAALLLLGSGILTYVILRRG